MDEIKRVISYIKSCREAGIDVIITVDKTRSHLILNALEKQIPKQPKNIKKITFRGSLRKYFKNGECPCCNAYVDTDDDSNVCSKCGQKLDW